MKRLIGIVLIALGVQQALAYEYNVRMPSSVACPRWKGARVGEWTMDYEAARSQAIAEGRGLIVFTTGSWWCPHCEAFEEKVLLENASRWRNYIQEKGYYLVMLDFPYRGHVDDSQVWKSARPECGDGWGFQCWLYDDDYLEENGLTREDGMKAIMDLYRLQKSLALESASPITIKSWDGSEEFTYGKVGYPTLIIYLPNGSEAGRFSPGSTNRDADDAYNYVVDKIDSIVSEALDEECGLCSDPDEWGLIGTKSETYRGWISGEGEGIAGTFEAKVSRKNSRGDIKIDVTADYSGKKRRLRGVGLDCCIEAVTLHSTGKDNSTMELMFDTNGVSGVYNEGDKTLTLVGARDVFKARDSVAKSRREILTTGTWTFAMAVTNSVSELTKGYGAFSVKVLKSGKASVRGVLPNGQAVSLSSKVIIGDSDTYCIPVFINKSKYSVGCCLWFKHGWLFNVTDISKWTLSGKKGFQAGWRVICSSVPSFGEIAGDYELVMPEVPMTIDGKALAIDPNGDPITIENKKWIGTEDSRFKGTMDMKTGMVSGSMKLFVETTRGSLRSKSCKVSGVVIDGTAYCSALIRGKSSYAIKVSACNACED